MAPSTNETVTKLAKLYQDIRRIEKTIDGISHHPECEAGIKYEVLKPIRPKLAWFRNALEAKIGKNVALLGKANSHDENRLLTKINRLFSYMTPDQQEFATQMMSGIVEGKVLRVTLSEEGEDELF
jgi:hypothetical protein